MVHFFNLGGGEINKEEFIKSYSANYFLDGKEIRADSNRKINQSSRWVEDKIEKILRDGISMPADIKLILAWKLGNLNHEASQSKESIEYNCKYKHDSVFKNNNGNEVKAKPYIDYIYKNLQDFKEKAKSYENLGDVFCKLRKDKPANFGNTYLLTLIFFLSNGAFPIYDRFAQIAIEAIKNGIQPNSKLGFPGFIESSDPQWEDGPRGGQHIESFYKKYQDDLKDIFCGELEDCKQRRASGKATDLKEAIKIERNIDRALWVYGHLFKKK
jgi:hypothetical protein